MVRRCTYPSIHFFRLKITVGCRLRTGFCVVCMCMCMCMCMCVCVCVLCVVCCVLCVVCCVVVLLCCCVVVLLCCCVVVLLCCCVVVCCCVLLCVVCVWLCCVLCVLLVVCAVVCSVCGVVRLGMRMTPSVCGFKTPPCVRSRRLRVYRENARMFNTCRECYTRQDRLTRRSEGRAEVVGHGGHQRARHDAAFQKKRAGPRQWPCEG